jgi:hypothetical protein
MPMQPNILLVEGEADKTFFTVICNMTNLRPVIKVASPEEIDPKSRNNKGSIFTVLPLLLDQLPDGEIERLAVVTDADHPENHGMGYRKTVQLFEATAASYGYKRIQPKGLRAGILFGHNDGLRDLGLWVMPNNRDDGTHEDWIKECLHQSEAALYANACRAVETLAKPWRFSGINRVKAEVSTWLAWQRVPGQGAHAACRAGLIDRDSVLFVELSEWLLRMFRN